MSEPEELRIQIEELNPPSDNGGGFNAFKEKFSEYKTKLLDLGEKQLRSISPGSFLLKPIELLEKTISKSNEFAAKIEANSPQIQIAQARADLIKLQADREADRVVGKDLRKLIELQAAQSASYTNIDASIVKALMPWATAWQETKNEFFSWAAKVLEKLPNVTDGFYEKTLSGMEYWVTLFQTQSFEEARRIADFNTQTRAEMAAKDAEQKASDRAGFDVFTNPAFIADMMNRAGLNRRAKQPGFTDPINPGGF